MAFSIFSSHRSFFPSLFCFSFLPSFISVFSFVSLPFKLFSLFSSLFHPTLPTLLSSRFFFLLIFLTSPLSFPLFCLYTFSFFFQFSFFLLSFSLPLSFLFCLHKVIFFFSSLSFLASCLFGSFFPFFTFFYLYFSFETTSGDSKIFYS